MAETYIGSPCKRCGLTEKYSSGQNCVACVKERTGKRGPEVWRRYAASDKGKKTRAIFRKTSTHKAIQNRWAAKGGRAAEYQRNKLQYKDTFLRKRYGISIEDYKRMHEHQDGLCAICKGLPQKKGLSVDHNHQSGKVRALLCSRCNTALGLVDENKTILKTMIQYIS